MERDRDPIRILDLGLIELWTGWYGENSGLSRAPIKYQGSKWNLYEYCDSLPTVNTDPMGLRGGPQKF